MFNYKVKTSRPSYHSIGLVLILLLHYNYYPRTTTSLRQNRRHYFIDVHCFTNVVRYHHEIYRKNVGINHISVLTVIRDMYSHRNNVEDTVDTKNDDSKLVIQRGRMGTLYQVPLRKPSIVDNSSNHGYPYENRIVLQESSKNTHPHRNVVIGKILCLYRFKIWWIRPTWVDSIAEVPSETIMILYRAQKMADVSSSITESTTNVTFHLYLAAPTPIHDDDSNNTIVSYTSSSFRGSSTCSSTNQHTTATTDVTDAVNSTNNRKTNDFVLLCSDHATTGMYVGCVSTGVTSHPDNDPFQLIQEGVHMASAVWYGRNLQQSTSLGTLDNFNIECEDGRDGINVSESSSVESFDSGCTMHTSLGWCSWNAMGTNVTHTKLIHAVSLLCQENDAIPIRWMIVDDGWQDTTTSNHTNINNGEMTLNKYNGDLHHTARLQSLHEDYKKFLPDASSLSITIDKIKKLYSIDTVLVWHALTGYWLGLHSSVPILNEANQQPNSDTITSQLYRPKFPSGIVQNDPSSLTEASNGLGIGIPDDIDHFYTRFYGELLQQTSNIDGVKVDAQAITGILHPSNDKNIMNASPSILLHTALTKNFIKHFVRSEPQATVVPIIHCMAHSPEIFFRLPSLYRKPTTSGSSSSRNAASVYKPFFRVADDYYPDNVASHGAQIVACAYNTLLFGNLRIVPDWDMFTTTLSDERLVRMHVVARCLSGGPIYISDNPSIARACQKDKILAWIACTDGTTFPCRHGGLPTISSLFIDPLEYRSMPKPLIIWNTNGDSTNVTSGIFGVFYVSDSGDWDPTTLDYVMNKESRGVNSAEGVVVSIQPGDIPMFASAAYRTTSFVALRFFDKSATILASPTDQMNFTMNYLQSESVSIVPIYHIMIGNDPIAMEYVVLGVRGKLNGLGATPRIETDRKADGSIVIVMKHVKGCGEFVMAFRLDRNVTDPIVTATVRIDDHEWSPNQLHWNRRHDDPTTIPCDPTIPPPQSSYRRRDAIDALSAFDFDLLSWEIPRVPGRTGRNPPATVTMRLAISSPDGPTHDSIQIK